MSKTKGFSAFDLSAAVNNPEPQEKERATPKSSKPKLVVKEKVPKEERVQRAIYFPKSLDDDLRQLAFNENTQVTKLVVEAVKDYVKRKMQ